MFATAIIVFREVLEAALIIGIVLAATRGVPARARWVAGGVAAGLLGAAVVALFAGAISDMAEGMGQEYLNAGILLAAVAMLAWHNIWMAEHARELSAHMNRVGTSVAEGELPMRALAFVVSFAVLREGSEVVLFLYGMAASAGGASQMALGGGLGLLAGAVVGAGLYLGLLRIPTRHLFRVTGWMILLLAAGMASEAARFLVQADALPALSAGPLWDTSSLLSDSNLIGQALHTLVGYTPRPLGIQLVAYLVTITIIGAFMIRKPRAPKLPPKLPKSAGAAAIVLLSLSLAGGMLTGKPAYAGDKVYSPIVHKGELELEFIGHRDKGGDQSHKWEVGYGVTDRWSTALYLETEKEPGDPLKAEAFAWENIIQLTEQGEHWLDAGLYLEYEHSIREGGHDKLEGKLLLEKETGRFINRVNIIFEKEISGPNPDGLELGYAWQTRYRLIRAFEFGVEGFGGFGELSEFKPAREQQHTLGPVVGGVIPITTKWNFKYELGYQVGLSAAAPDNRVKAMLELETYF
ncbi:FTR1 family protein [Kordiimonas sp. A6E486]|nr:FTR1 family protein [Kordiimonas marina]MCJ9428664.1 FTR1 family protein [Kordiimonas marina]